jgi:hypothetical protein
MFHIFLGILYLFLSLSRFEIRQGSLGILIFKVILF